MDELARLYELVSFSVDIRIARSRRFLVGMCFGFVRLDETIRLGLIGCGGIVQLVHARAYLSLPDAVKVVALADVRIFSGSVKLLMCRLTRICRLPGYVSASRN